jgi:transposase
LVGRLGAHHGAVAAASAAHIDLPDADIAALDQEVAAHLGPFSDRLPATEDHPWGDPGRYRGLRAEAGGDMSRFPSPATWPLGPAKKRAGRATTAPDGFRKGPVAETPLGESAKAAPRTNATYLVGQYRHVPTRRGPSKRHRGRGRVNCHPRVTHAFQGNDLQRPRL